MKHPLVDDLNEIGMVWRGEEVEVVAVDFYRDETEKT